MRRSGAIGLGRSGLTLDFSRHCDTESGFFFAQPASSAEWAAAAAVEAAARAAAANPKTPQDDDGKWEVVSEARALLLRAFPMPWRAFLQLTHQSHKDEDGGEEAAGVPAVRWHEQPWIFVESFETEPPPQEFSLAILAFIDELYLSTAGDNRSC